MENDSPAACEQIRSAAKVVGDVVIRNVGDKATALLERTKAYDTVEGC